MGFLTLPIISILFFWLCLKFIRWFIAWVIEPLTKKEPEIIDPSEDHYDQSLKDAKEILAHPDEYDRELVETAKEILESAVEEENNQQNPIKIEIKDSKFDSSRIKSYEGEETKQFEFRPQKFEQFIGQKEAKARAQIIMKKARRGIRGHFLVDGIKGHGKTTFVELVAKNLNAHLIQRVGKQIEEEELENIIREINSSTSENVMFFIDEFDTMDWKVIKVLNPIIEQFKINGINIKPFIFAGATINKHSLIKTVPDTLDRIPTHIKFERYSSEDIATILRQYKEQLYPEDDVPEEVIKIISENCKFNPRTSISLLEDFIVTKNIKKVLKNCNIIMEGLTNIDIRILRVLRHATRPMGANALAMKCKLSQAEYTREYEPFLVEYNYVDRIPSRVITDKGQELIEGLKL